MDFGTLFLCSVRNASSYIYYFIELRFVVFFKSLIPMMYYSGKEKYISSWVNFLLWDSWRFMTKNENLNKMFYDTINPKHFYYNENIPYFPSISFCIVL